MFCELFIENLKICKKIKGFKLYGFVIIPDHIHSQIIQFLKRHFTRDINFVLSMDIEGGIRNCNFHEGEIRASRLQNGKYKNFQNIINMHDKKLKQIKNDFIKKYNSSYFKKQSFKWQQSFYDHTIRNEQDCLNHLNDIALNCIKHKICYDENKYEWLFLNKKHKDLIDGYFI